MKTSLEPPGEELRIISEQERLRAHDVVFETGAWQVSEDFRPFVKPFASGKPANNRLDLEIPIDDFQPPEIQDAWLEPMEALVWAQNPDAIWGVPNGGQKYAIKIGERTGLPVIRLIKDRVLAGYRTYRYHPEAIEYNLKIIRKAKRLAGIDDIGNELTSLTGVLFNSPQLEELAAKTVGITVGWFRGLLKLYKQLEIPVTPVIAEHIPNIITPNHKFYRKYGSLAVKVSAA